MTLMTLPWYYLIVYIAIGSVLLFVFDKFNIIKSKALRYFIVIFIYTIIFWVIFDVIQS